MNRFLFATIIAAALALCAAATAAPPCCGTYGPTYAPTYSTPARSTWPQYSDWEYERIEGRDGLFKRFRFRRDSASSSTRETDDFAWALLGNGQYEQRGRLADLLGKARDLLPQLGKSEAGYERSEYGLLKAFSYLAKASILPKGLPEIPNTRDIITPLADDMAAREQNAFLLAKQGLELQHQQQLSNNELRKAQLDATTRLATVETLAKANERRLAESIRGILEADKQAAIQLEVQQETGAGNSLANIPIDNRELATLVGAKCWGCHGPAKQDGGINFANARAWGEPEWDAIHDEVSSGRMPRGGQPLSRDQIDLFKAEWKAAILRGK
jgi:hypothetical protein